MAILATSPKRECGGRKHGPILTSLTIPRCQGTIGAVGFEHGEKKSIILDRYRPAYTISVMTCCAPSSLGRLFGRGRLESDPLQPDRDARFGSNLLLRFCTTQYCEQSA